MTSFMSKYRSGCYALMRIVVGFLFLCHGCQKLFGFHHPHLRGATVGVWPLSVFGDNDAAGEPGTLRAIAIADLHNLVFQRSYRVVPAITCGEIRYYFISATQNSKGG